MVTLIERLAAKGLRLPDRGWELVLPHCEDPDYGKLSKKDFEGIEDGARVDVDEYEKDAARDFALWKAVKTAEAARNRTGRRRLGRAGRAGTSSARRWRRRCWATASTCMRAAKT